MAADASALLDVAQRVCPDARAAGPDDAFAGCRPTVRVAPSGTAQVAELMAATDPLDAAVGVRGGATKAGYGAPARGLDLLLDTTCLDRVLEYDPGDLVVRAETGVRLADLQARLATENQWLGLDPPEAGATLGGVVAAAASGPRRHRYGAVRDLLIGATFVLADGTAAKAGGKVVKNVAGYDLCKLLTGSLGTLAVLTEVTFRLHPRPRAGGVVAVPVHGSRSVRTLLETLRGSRLEPAAVELDLDLADGEGAVTLLFEGRPEVVEQQAAQAAALFDGDRGTTPPPGFGTHPWSDGDGDGALGLRVACAPAAVPDAVEALIRFADGAGRARLRGRAVVGVLEAAVAPQPAALAGALAALRVLLSRLDGTAVLVPPITRPASVTTGPEVDVWGPVRGLDLMRAVKDRFDPGHRLAPGRFVGGI